MLTLIALLIILGLPLVFAAAYVITGLNSVGYYGPPIGQVMAFYANATTVLATAVTPIAAVIAALLAIPRFRRFFAPQSKSESTIVSVESPEKLTTEQSTGAHSGLVKEQCRIRPSEFVHYKLDLEADEILEVTLTSDGFFDAYFFTESSFKTFDHGGEARELEGTEEVRHYETRFGGSRRGRYYLVIQNHDKATIVADVQIDVEKVS